jgi:hypothetical protein
MIAEVFTWPPLDFEPTEEAPVVACRTTPEELLLGSCVLFVGFVIKLFLLLRDAFG